MQPAVGAPAVREGSEPGECVGALPPRWHAMVECNVAGLPQKGASLLSSGDRPTLFADCCSCLLGAAEVPPAVSTFPGICTRLPKYLACLFFCP